MKKNSLISLLVISAILLLAAYLRIYQLEGIPNGLIPDEAIRGYDAYSILKTGADSYGTPWPLFLRSFDDYTPALYSYLCLPFIAIFGLSAFSTRLASAFIGIFVVALAYQATRRSFGQTAALVASFLLAVSPWHILTSRTGTERNLLSLGPILTVMLAYRGLSRPNYLIGASIAAGISLYGYAPIKAFLPILILGFIIIYRRELRQQKRALLIALLIFGVIASPIYIFSFTPAGMNRFNLIYEGSKTSFVEIVPQLIRNYFSYFSPAFFILSQYTEDYQMARYIVHLKSVGLLSWFELALILLGLVKLITMHQKSAWFVLYWLIVAPLGINFHYHSPRPTLWLTVIPIPHLLAGIGFAQLFSLIKPSQGRFLHQPRSLFSYWAKPVAAVLLLGLSLGILNNFRLMYYDLFFEFPIYGAKDWFYGIGPANVALQTLKHQYDEVDLLGESLSHSIYLLFYSRYDPATRQAELTRNPQNIWQNIGDYNIGRVENYLQHPGCHLILTTMANAQNIKAQAPQIITLRRFDLPTGEANLGLFAFASPAPEIIQLGATFNNEIMLQGSGMVNSAGTTSAFRPGQAICVILQWQALTKIPRDYTVFVHLVGPEDSTTQSLLWAQHDGAPLHGYKPTSTWSLGEIIQDPHRFVIPSETPSGHYKIVTGLYDANTGQRLPVRLNNNQSDDKATLLELNIQRESED